MFCGDIKDHPFAFEIAVTFVVTQFRFLLAISGHVIPIAVEKGHIKNDFRLLVTTVMDVSLLLTLHWSHISTSCLAYEVQ